MLWFYEKWKMCSQLDQTRDRTVSKERLAQSKVLELEAQLSRTQAELNQLRHSKEDVSI